MLIEANCHVRLSHLKNCFQIFVLWNIHDSLFNSLTKSHYRLYATAVTKKKMMPQNAVHQRFSNWGPRTKGGPRRVPTGSARGFQKVVNVCMFFYNFRPICFQICTHKLVTQSQCIALKCCCGLARQAFCWCLLVVLRVRVLLRHKFWTSCSVLVFEYCPSL